MHNFPPDLPIKAKHYTVYLSYGASFDAILAAVLTIWCPKVLLLELSRKTKVITHGCLCYLELMEFNLFLEIDYKRRLCLSSSPETQG